LSPYFSASVERAPVVLNGARLVVHRLLLQAIGFGLGHRRIQVRELLDGDVLLVLQRHGVRLLAVALQRLLAGLHGLSLFVDLLAEEGGRFPGRQEPDLEVLLDVGLRQRVGGGHGELWVGRGVLDVHEARVADGRDPEAAEERVDYRSLGGGLPELLWRRA
jgi:hypothetical protein